MSTFGENQTERGIGVGLNVYGEPPAPSERRATAGKSGRPVQSNRIRLFAVAIGVIHGLVVGIVTERPGPAALSALVVAVVAYGAGRWLLAPIGRYVDHVQRLAAGDFDEEVPQARDKQFGELSSALEAMRLHLRTWMSQIARNAIEFEGSLQVLDLVHVMHFLRAGKRTGTLLLQRGGETAMLFWEKGELCGALVDGLAGPEALTVPFSWERGSFKFSPRLNPVSNIDSRWEVLLLNGVRSVDQPRVWSRFVPKKTSPVRRSRVADHMPLRQLLTTDEWAVWNALTGELSADDLSTRLGQPAHKLWHNLYCFAALGIVQSADEEVQSLPTRQTGALSGSSPTAATFKPVTPFPTTADPDRPNRLAHRSGDQPKRKAAGDDVINSAFPGDNVIPLRQGRSTRRERDR